MKRARKIKAQDTETARTICKEGIPVSTYAWNSGNPGAGAGVEYIYEFEGRLAVASSEDDTVHGPMMNLDLYSKRTPTS
jgi:hypothetical protein